MSDQPSPEQKEPLQFDVAEPVTATASAQGACANCKLPLTSEYYETSGQMVCAACRNTITTGLNSAAGKEPFILAMVYGLGAALVGALVWWGVRAATGYEIGLVAIAVGFMVGYAVRAGSRGRGGRRYQILAVVLTYLGVTLNYVPDVVKGIIERPASEAAKDPAVASGGDPAAPTTEDPARGKSGAPKSTSYILLNLILFGALVIGVSAAAPVLAGVDNIMGILIIGFALWEAWKLNRGLKVEFNGPFAMTPAAHDRPTPPAPMPATS